MSSIIGGVAGGLGNINPFGGFAPFPNSIMIPFMGAQSAVLGFQFGIQYELAKRYIKSLSNDDFNNMVNQENHEFLNSIIKTQALEQITNFRNLIPDYQSLQNDIIEQSVQIELKKAERTPSAMAEIIEAVYAGVQGLDPTATTAGFFAKLLLAITVPGNPFPTTDEFAQFYEQYLSGGTTEPPSEEPPSEPQYEDPSTYTAFTTTYTLDGTEKTFESGSNTLIGHKERMQTLRQNWGQNLSNGLGNLGYDLFMPLYYDWIWQTYGDGPTTYTAL